jgi:hypothetical protein
VQVVACLTRERAFVAIAWAVVIVAILFLCAKSSDMVLPRHDEAIRSIAEEARMQAQSFVAEETRARVSGWIGLGLSRHTLIGRGFMFTGQMTLKEARRRWKERWEQQFVVLDINDNYVTTAVSHYLGNRQKQADLELISARTVTSRRTNSDISKTVVVDHEGMRMQCTSTHIRIPVDQYDETKAMSFITHVIDVYRRHTDTSDSNVVQVFRWQMTDSAHEWSWVSENPAYKRTLSTIVGKNHEAIVTDVRRFMDDADFYAENGIPYKRTYLLHGPPGTGKTTLIKLVATMLDKAIYYLDLNTTTTDDALLKSVQEICDGILVIEDVNVAQLQRFNPATFLNLCDGIHAVTDTVMFITTNDLPSFRDHMPPEFFREGRIDVIKEIGKATPAEVRAYVAQFYARSLHAHDPSRRSDTPATVEDTADAFARVVDGIGGVGIAVVEKCCIESRTDPQAALSLFRKLHAES